MGLLRKAQKTPREVPEVPIGINLPSNIFEDISTQEEAMAKVTSLLADQSKKEVITELTDREIKLISSLLSVEKEYKTPIIRNFCDNLMVLRISKDRKGRREIIEITKGEQERLSQGLRARLGRLIGGRGGYV